MRRTGLSRRDFLGIGVGAVAAGLAAPRLLAGREAAAPSSAPAASGAPPGPRTMPMEIRVRTGEIVHPSFGGVGFHAFQHSFPASATEMDEVIYKRWRELNPSFVRMTHRYAWDQAMLDQMAVHLSRMKETGAEAYITTWDPPQTQNDAERRAFARRIADHLEYLIRDKGLTNIHYYCMTNELTLTAWGSMVKDLPTFKAYHQALYDEFKARKLPVGLVATDASPQSYWWTNEWAAQNMDDITAIYCGHHYVDGHELGDAESIPGSRTSCGRSWRSLAVKGRTSSSESSVPSRMAARLTV